MDFSSYMFNLILQSAHYSLSHNDSPFPFLDQFLHAGAPRTDVPYYVYFNIIILIYNTFPARTIKKPDVPVRCIPCARSPSCVADARCQMVVGRPQDSPPYRSIPSRLITPWVAK